MRRSRLVVLVAWVLVVGAVGSGSVLSAPAVGQAPSPAGLCDASAVDQFSDVADTDYAAAYILCMRALGLSQGGSDGGYGPDRELSRGQMASFLIRLWTDQLGQQCPTGVVVPFADTAGTTHETNIEPESTDGLVGVVAEGVVGGLSRGWGVLSRGLGCWWGRLVPVFGGGG